MDPFTAWLGKRVVGAGAGWWIRNRPFSKDKRAFRKERRRIRKENRARRKKGLPPLEEPKMETGLRTSSAGVIGAVVGYAATFVVGLVPALSFLLDPQVQLAVVALVTWVFARFNVTPVKPGVV